ncbi:MAG: hypothetical protein R2848_09230 [Thermomicrobiales bacterium]
MMRATGLDIRGRHDECVAISPIEPLRNVASKLDVLALILTHGHQVGVVQDDVGHLQHGIVGAAEADSSRRCRPPCPLNCVIRRSSP